MKLLLFFGSDKKQNLYNACDLFVRSLADRGHDVTVVNRTFENCIGCRTCLSTGGCVIKDDFPVADLKACDGIILLSPVYFFGFNAKTKAFLDRLICTPLDGKIFTSLTLSGSDTTSRYCGYDLIDEVIRRTSEYCGSVYVKPLNLVTHDTRLDIADVREDIEKFAELLEVAKNEAESKAEVKGE